MKLKEKDKYVKFLEDIIKFHKEFDENNKQAEYNHIEYKRAKGRYMLMRLEEEGYVKQITVRRKK